jgi:hypothetical protein
MIFTLIHIFINAIPHILYYYIYNKPIDYKIFCHRAGLDLILFQLWLSVICRFIAAVLFLHKYISFFVFNYIGLFMIIMGYSLIIYIWKLLGHKGLFYGRELGLPLPWIKNNIFKYIKHPQYIGAIIFYQGLATLFLNHCAIFTLSMYTFFYIHMIISESN